MRKGIAGRMHHRHFIAVVPKTLALLLCVFTVYGHGLAGAAARGAAENPGRNTRGTDLVETDTVAEALSRHLDRPREPRRVWDGCEPVYVTRSLVSFYAWRDWQPVWVSENGPSEAAAALVDALGESENHGLIPDDYNHACLSGWLDALEKDRPWGFTAWDLDAFEAALTDSFVRYARHLSGGKAYPERIYRDWRAEKQGSGDIYGLLESIASPADVRETLAALAPACPGYTASMAEVRRLRGVIDSGGWPEIPRGQNLRKGDRSSGVCLLANRLAMDGDLPAGGPDIGEDDAGCLFDRKLEEALLRFQNRHGLTPDGVAGPSTLSALNRPAQDRLRTVLVNMERRRWLPRDFGSRHIVVNTAAFMLAAYEDRRRVLEMAVIVGEQDAKTPQFSRNVSYLEINPYWNVPRGVLERVILPRIRKNPDYLGANRYKLITARDADSGGKDAEAIDWSGIDADNFPGRLRQKPGPWNSLGRIKFMFPNPYHIYLHDTPDRHLFEKPVRTFSSGCIRVDKPVELALFTLKNDPAWDRRRIEKAIESGDTTVVYIRAPVGVHLVYRTFWIGPDGDANYRNDVYELDELLWRSLND